MHSQMSFLIATIDWLNHGYRRKAVTTIDAVQSWRRLGLEGQALGDQRPCEYIALNGS